jgi:hypothetical protein
VAAQGVIDSEDAPDAPFVLARRNMEIDSEDAPGKSFF